MLSQPCLVLAYMSLVSLQNTNKQIRISKHSDIALHLHRHCCTYELRAPSCRCYLNECPSIASASMLRPHSRRSRCCSVLPKWSCSSLSYRTPSSCWLSRQDQRLRWLLQRLLLSLTALYDVVRPSVDERKKCGKRKEMQNDFGKSWSGSGKRVRTAELQVSQLWICRC